MKKFTGRVVSTKNKNTAIVEIVRFRIHPLYEKRVKRTKRYAVHDTVGVSVGDTVIFQDSKPFSKTKHWLIQTSIAKSTEKKGEQQRGPKRNSSKSGR